MTRPRRLTCACCGEAAIGRQWWNRDTGFGICGKCIAWFRRCGDSEEDIRGRYGIEGVHFSISEERTST